MFPARTRWCPPAPPRPATAAAGYAELFVAAFLSGGQELSLSHFLRAAPTPGIAPLEVERTAAVQAGSTGPGRWWVLVAATVRDPLTSLPNAVGAPDPTPTPERPELRVEHYGVQVAEVDGVLTAVAWPALLPNRYQPPAATPVTGQPREPRADDPLAVTVRGFLAAFLTPADDLERWVAPDAAIAPVRPPPFTALTLTGLAAADDGAGGRHVLAQVAGTRATGRVQLLQYPLRLLQRDGRWEVAQLLDDLPTREGVSR